MKKSLSIIALLILGLAPSLGGAQAVGTAPVGTVPVGTVPVGTVPMPEVQLVLVKIDSYADSKEIKNSLLKMEGVHAVDLQTEVAGLIRYHVAYSGAANRLAEQLTATLGQKYTITQKTLPSGVLEINVAKGS